jgi:bifunctional UDP-N-acetylglucosamine pyrophosphorylase / glucosamine-1-phosphate N-acetyltransferase
MTTQRLQGIILAAGKSSRFNTSMTKLSFSLCGQELLVYPVKLLAALKIPTLLVLGYQKEVLLTNLHKHDLAPSYIEQEEQRGTGHAVRLTQPFWQADHTLIMNGDMPLVTDDIISTLITTHMESNSTLSLVIAHNNDLTLAGYGRIVREQGRISIVEAHDFVGDSTTHCFINAGIYLIKRSFLEKTIEHLEPNQKSGELYITDLVKKANEMGEPIQTVTAPFDAIRGINTLKELWIAEHIIRSEIINLWMNQGVRFIAPQTVHIDKNVTIGPDTIIAPGVQLCGGTTIGKKCLIDAFSVITNSQISNNVSIHPHSVITDAILYDHVQVGPLAHIRNQSIIFSNAHIGNFVEVSKSSVGPATKAKHLAYLGNAQIGSAVNIGAGTITCNYNGTIKQTTIIEDNAFIGANSSLIAPVTIGQSALVGAGSVITHNVPSHALAIARAQQITKEHYTLPPEKQSMPQEPQTIVDNSMVQVS